MFYIKRASLAQQTVQQLIVEVRRVCTILRELGHAQCHMHGMPSNVYTVLKTQASTKSNHQGTNILVVKGTAHTRLKEIRTKAMVISFC